MAVDRLSLLSHSTLHLAKIWKEDGTIKGYDKPKFFTLREVEVADIHELSLLLSEIEPDPHTCIIGGKYVGDALNQERDPEYKPGMTRRIREVFTDQPLHALLIEVDKFRPLAADPVKDPVGACNEYLQELPACFHGKSLHFQLSNSAGAPGNEGLFKAHLWFWLTTPYTGAQLRAWVNNNAIPADPSIFSEVQVRYCAAPVFEAGRSDPVAMRSGFLKGALGDEVDLQLDINSLGAVTRPSLKTRGAIPETDDPLALWLGESGLALGAGNEGQVYIECPFADQHSAGSNGTDTAYLPAGTGGFAAGSFKCLHASCASRNPTDFENALGWTSTKFDEIEAEEPATQARKKFEVIDAADYEKRPAVEWIVKGVIPRSSLILFYGGSGDGKTFVVLDLMLSIARGIEWNGRRVKQGRVAYVCAEGRGGFVTRLKAYAHEYCEAGLSLSGVPLGIIPDTPNFRTPDDVKSLAQAVNAWGKTDIIVVDTLAQVTAGADENAGKDMGVALKHCEMLHQLTGAVVCLVHHSGKDAARGARGWSGLKAPLDAEFEISREGDFRKLWVEKMKEGLDGFGWDFTLASKYLGDDADGDPVSSCIVRYTGETSNGRTNGKTKKQAGKWQTLAFEASDAVGGPSAFSTAEAYYKSVVDQMTRVAPAPLDGRDRRRERAARAVEGLIEGGILPWPEM